ncbi:transposase family protein [Streptomyces luteireticuli]|uniref:transposase family protein n=1 Tax=Streptomyces luteireticuli TaxID=173858 RepID=UPI0035589816
MAICQRGHRGPRPAHTHARRRTPSAARRHPHPDPEIRGRDHRGEPGPAPQRQTPPARHEHPALTDTTSEPVFPGGARPGPTHDLTTARTDGIIGAVTDAGAQTTTDPGHHGAGGTIRTPTKPPRDKTHNGREKKANAALAQLRAPAERAFTKLKRRHALDTVRTSPNHITTLPHTLPLAPSPPGHHPRDPLRETSTPSSRSPVVPARGEGREGSTGQSP